MEDICEIVVLFPDQVVDVLHCHTQWYLRTFFPFPYSLVMYLFSAAENSTALCSREWQAQCCDTPLGAGSPSRWQGGSHVAILVFNFCGNSLLLLSIQGTSIHSLIPRPCPAFHCVWGEPGTEATLSVHVQANAYTNHQDLYDIVFEAHSEEWCNDGCQFVLVLSVTHGLSSDLW